MRSNRLLTRAWMLGLMLVAFAATLPAAAAADHKHRRHHKKQCHEQSFCRVQPVRFRAHRPVAAAYCAPVTVATHRPVYAPPPVYVCRAHGDRVCAARFTRHPSYVEHVRAHRQSQVVVVLEDGDGWDSGWSGSVRLSW
ncbi:MAG TPA: hypothetical protein VFD07_11700 [Candidatus Krumholzibacteria bacterium]|nr:hypothetical protein [Candidatus Krumholzibacteria bacterium]